MNPPDCRTIGKRIVNSDCHRARCGAAYALALRFERHRDANSDSDANPHRNVIEDDPDNDTDG